MSKRTITAAALVEAWETLTVAGLYFDRVIKEKHNDERGAELSYNSALDAYILRHGKHGNGFTDYSTVEAYTIKKEALKAFNGLF